MRENGLSIWLPVFSLYGRGTERAFQIFDFLYLIKYKMVDK